MAVISVNFGPGYGTILTSDVKATFSDKLGTVGGTFGMFVGISFLGIFDLFHDLFAALKDKICKKKTKRKR